MNRDQRALLWLSFAWLVAIAATSGSLYFSQIRHFMPCELCWYQRILMYPLVLILGIAVYRLDAGVRPYVLAMTLTGGTISLIHYLEQKVPDFHPTACAATPIPCNTQYVHYLGGWLTIPMMALIAFALITYSMLRLPRR